MKEFAKMHLCSSKFCLALLLLYTLAAPALAQGMKERACQIIQADSYETWVERLISYEEILNEAAKAYPLRSGGTGCCATGLANL
jgi:hypothetical protein